MFELGFEVVSSVCCIGGLDGCVPKTGFGFLEGGDVASRACIAVGAELGTTRRLLNKSAYFDVHLPLGL